MGTGWRKAFVGLEEKDLRQTELLLLPNVLNWVPLFRFIILQDQSVNKSIINRC